MTEVRRLEFLSVTVTDGRAATAIVNEVCCHGLPLSAFSLSLDSDGALQLHVAAAGSTEALAVRLHQMHLNAVDTRRGFLLNIDRGACTIADAVERLDRAGIPVVSMQVVDSGPCASAILCFESRDAPRAAAVLDTWEIEHDVVDEASEESFPASDSPAWLFSAKS